MKPEVDHEPSMSMTPARVGSACRILRLCSGCSVEATALLFEQLPGVTDLSRRPHCGPNVVLHRHICERHDRDVYVSPAVQCLSRYWLRQRRVTTGGGLELHPKPRRAVRERSPSGKPDRHRRHASQPVRDCV